MDKKIKDEWVKRLESGKIKQATGNLAIGETRCCLGVLCDIAVEQGLITKKTTGEELGEPTYDDIDDSEIVWYYDGSDEILPESVRQWAGLDDDSPAVEIGNLTVKSKRLADINDEGSTFKEIAELIKKQL
jgi:hypothetical protein